MKKSVVRALASGETAFKRPRHLSLRRLHSGIGAARHGVLRNRRLFSAGARRAPASRANCRVSLSERFGTDRHPFQVQSNTLLAKYRSLVLGPSGVQVAPRCNSTSALTLPSSGPVPAGFAVLHGPLKSNVRQHEMHKLRSLLILFSVFLVAGSGVQAAPMNKCMVNGTVTYQQGPCPSDQVRKAPTVGRRRFLAAAVGILLFRG